MPPSLEPLNAEHLARFPVAGMEIDFWQDNAAAIICDGEVLGICAISVKDDTAYAGVALSPAIRRHAVFLHRKAHRAIRGLERMGVNRIVAHAESPKAAHWLKRLGFEKRGDGYEKCLVQT